MKEFKTELLLDLRGKGSVKEMQHLMSQDLKLQVNSQWLHDYLRIVDRYKHLGTWITSGGRLLLDIRTKVAIGHSTITKYRTSIFANKALMLTRKMQLFQQLVLSAFIFNAGAWHTLDNSEARDFYNGIFALYKRVAVLHGGPELLQLSHDELLIYLDTLHPSCRLQIARLRQFHNLAKHGQDQTWGLLQQDLMWWETLQKDIKWLSMRAPQAHIPTDIASQWAAVFEWFASPDNRVKNAIQRATKMERTYQTILSNWTRWHKEIVECLREAKIFQTETLGDPNSQHGCLVCGVYFTTASAWSVHAFRKHGRTTPARRWARGTQCPGCLREYSTHVALVHHLQYKARCRQIAQTTLSPAEPEAGYNSRLEKQMRRPRHRPFLQAEGPRVQNTAVTDLPLTTEEQRLHDAWTDVLTNHSSELGEDLVLHFKQIAATTFLACAELRETFARWLLALPEDFCTVHMLKQGHIFLQNCYPKWFLGENTHCAIEAIDPHEQIRRWRESLVPVTQTIVRGPVYRAVVIAHLFSGRRRTGDLQSHAETWFATQQREHLILSVDIIFDAHMGDLLRAETKALFRRAIREGIITAIISGPP